MSRKKLGPITPERKRKSMLELHKEKATAVQMVSEFNEAETWEFQRWLVRLVLQKEGFVCSQP